MSTELVVEFTNLFFLPSRGKVLLQMEEAEVGPSQEERETSGGCLILEMGDSEKKTNRF